MKVGKKTEKYRQLKVIMFAKRFSQQKLSKTLNITPQALNAKLNGRSDFTIREAEKLIEVLEISNPIEIFFAHSVRIA